MKKLKDDLQSLSKELNALSGMIEKLVKSIDRIEKAQTVAKGKPKAKIPEMVPAIMKSADLTDTDKVVNIIKQSKKGVNVPSLIKITGFGDKKIRNIVFRASKQGKIKKAGRGIYVA
jgi:hypothetical protein